MRLKEFQKRGLEDVRKYLEELTQWKKKAEEAREKMNLTVNFPAEAWNVMGLGRAYIPHKDGLGNPLPPFLSQDTYRWGKDAIGSQND